ncbi:MAG: hypothetical protein KF799_11990 [Bdellovibrionales bacterium]|nr:hypothetical protein [Bdellovibrionales bacterium]
MLKNIDWNLIRARLKEAILVLPHFFKNPIQGMRTLPAWDWPTILILQGAFAAVCAILTSAVARNLLGMFTGIVIGPITQLLLISISSGFFYYTFMFFFGREIPYRQIYITLIFAAIPGLIANIISPILPPAMMVGGIASIGLLYVGFVSNFYLDRMKVRNLLGALLIIYAAMWAVQIFKSNSRHNLMREKATPESLDILEKELND